MEGVRKYDRRGCKEDTYDVKKKTMMTLKETKIG
jgi:hypothetical protein